MATFKKTAKKKSSAKSGDKVSPQQQAERLSRSLSESAQQIWLAGVGAFGRAQAEGTKLFEGLVKEGVNLEQSARKFTGGQAEVLRDAVESKVDQARERAADTWDRLEKVFEERVNKAMVKLGVPGRDDLADLSRRVDTLTGELRRQGGRKSAPAKPAKPAKAAPVRRSPARKSAAPAPVQRAATRKTAASATTAPAKRVVARKTAAKKTGRKAIATPKKPVAP